MPLDQRGSLSTCSILTSSYDGAFLCLGDESKIMKCLCGISWHIFSCCTYLRLSAWRPRQTRMWQSWVRCLDSKGCVRNSWKNFKRLINSIVFCEFESFFFRRVYFKKVFSTSGSLLMKRWLLCLWWVASMSYKGNNSQCEASPLPKQHLVFSLFESCFNYI